MWHLSGVSITLDASSTSNSHQSPGWSYSELPHRSAHEAKVLKEIVIKETIKTPPKPKGKVKNRSMIPLSSFSTEQPATDSQGCGTQCCPKPKRLLGGPNCTNYLQTAQNQKKWMIKCSQNMMLVSPLADGNLSPYTSEATANTSLPSLEKVFDSLLWPQWIAGTLGSVRLSRKSKKDKLTRWASCFLLSVGWSFLCFVVCF